MKVYGTQLSSAITDNYYYSSGSSYKFECD